MNLLKLIASYNPMQHLFPSKPTHSESAAGAGYYAFRHNTSAGGKPYTKLVKRDKSPAPKYNIHGSGIPSVGHNPRRQAILDKRAAKAAFSA